MTHLITFATYGSHLHGSPRGSVDRKYNTPGTPGRPIQSALERYEREAMKDRGIHYVAAEQGDVMALFVGRCRVIDSYARPDGEVAVVVPNEY